MVYTITPSGAATYSYSSGSQTVSPSASAVYSVTGSSSAGCAASNIATMNLFVAPLPTISANNGFACIGRNYTIQPAGASTYTFSSGSPVVSPSVNTNYSITGTSSLGCVSASPAVITLTAVNPPVVSIGNGTMCMGQVYTLTPTGASTYTFSGGSQTVSPANITSYSVTGTASTGCVSSNTAVATLTVYNIPTVTIVGPTLVCTGYTYSYSVSGAANTFTWSNGATGSSITHTPQAGGIFSVVAEDIIGCKSAASKTLNAKPTPTLTVAGNSVVCGGTSLTLAVSGANSYSWTGLGTTASIVITPTVTSTYTIQGTTNGCTGIALETVTIMPAPVISANVDKPVTCAGTPVTLFASGATSYTWTGGVTDNVPFTPTLTVYTVTGVGTNGCKGAATITLTVHSLPPVVVTSSSPKLCEGQAAILYVTGPTTQTWSTGQQTSTISIQPVANTPYTVTGMNAQGCISTATIMQTIVNCTDLDEYNLGSVRVYPNPTAGRFFISVENTSNVKYEVFNMIEQKITSGSVNGNSSEIDLSNISSGVYYIRLYHGTEFKKSVKIVKD
jgi:hypothetical protein